MDRGGSVDQRETIINQVVRLKSTFAELRGDRGGRETGFSTRQLTAAEHLRKARNLASCQSLICKNVTERTRASREAS